MARGSSYGNKPNDPSVALATSKNIPRRATREIRTVTADVQEPETQIAYPETQVPRTPRRISQPPVESVALTARKYSAPHPLAQHRSWLKLLLVSFSCVLIGALVLISASVYMRNNDSNGGYTPYNTQTFSVQLGGSYDAFNRWNSSTGPIPTQTPLPKNPGPYSVLGKPTVSANFLNQVLASYHSPTAGMGQSLYDLGVQYGIDPVYAIAFFMHESLFGTTGEARVTLSLGNERCIPDRNCIDQDRGGYAQMNSWQDGFEHWYKLIRNLYVAQWGLVTVDQIIPKYAPNSDGNDEAEYIATLKHEIDVWRAGTVRP